MRYIRHKDDHSLIVAYGVVEPGGLGAFDADVYEEVEGDLPEDAKFQTRLPLGAVLEKTLHEILARQTVEPNFRAAIYNAKSAIREAIASQDIEAIHAIILAVELPESLEPARLELLELLPSV